MRSTYLRTAVIATAFSFATAQSSDIIPQDLQAGFASSSVELQVSYTGEAENGFLDGTTFEKDAVSKLPEFALGDSSGISAQKRYTILLLDTTCQTPTLHYARANFRYNFQIVSIVSESTPALVYLAPGAFGETGDERKYSFLMFSQPRGEEIADLKIPGEGEAFDIDSFKSDNGLKDAAGGVGMVVKLGGETSCEQGAPVSPGPGREPETPEQPEQPEQPETRPSPTPSPSPEEPTPTPERPTPTPQRPSPTSTPSSSISVIEAPVDSISLIIGSSAAGESDTPEPTGTAIQTPEESGADVITRTSTVVGDGAPAPSTFVTSAGAGETLPGTETTTGLPLQATSSDASGLPFGFTSCAGLVAAVVFAGLLV